MPRAMSLFRYLLKRDSASRELVLGSDHSRSAAAPARGQMRDSVKYYYLFNFKPVS